MNKLALLGGIPVRLNPFPPYPILGDEEREAVLQVLNEGRLSTFIASPGEHFLGGKRIRQFEEKIAAYQGVKYAVAFNSGTAALHAAVVSVGVQPLQEVITTPYTFTSSATCALMHNAVPVFADVDSETFCINPVAIRKIIGLLSRAVIPVHLFGQAAPMDEIMNIARVNGCKVIEDCAQALGAKYKGKPIGSIGDCGIFSFQESKNLAVGEGGMLITNNEEIAEVARLIRNHGETVAHTLSHRTYSSEILGYNYRMTELEAALGLVQLKYLDERNTIRQELANFLTENLIKFPGIIPPKTREGSTHVYYVYPFIYHEDKIGIPRDLFAKALQAEGIPVGTGYVRPLYYSPLFQQRRSFAYRYYKGIANYNPGLCPVAESLHNHYLLVLSVVRPPATLKDMKDIIQAIEKIMDMKRELLLYARENNI